MTNVTHYDQATAEALAAQFTENTGTHFLDSGGAYGRAWERNQGKTVEDFLNAPSVTEANFEYNCFSINMFQWLLGRLTLHTKFQRMFEAFVADSDEPHLVDAEEFAELLHDGSHYMSDSTGPRSFNSYNGETLLDGTIQGILFSHKDEMFVALQIHGGCDVRGGYTAAKIYQIDDSDYWYDESIDFWCPSCEHHFELTSSGVEWIDHDGTFITDPWEGSEFNREEGQCPKCGKVGLEADARNQH